MIYGADTWVIINKKIKRLSVVEMWHYRRLERLSRKEIRENVKASKRK